MPRKQTNDFYIDYETFKLGLYALEDTTKAPFGTARTMKNMRITDRGGIAPRLGTSILGTNNTSGNRTRGIYNFRRSLETDELLLKPSGTILEVYSKSYPDAGWFTLKSGLTSDKEFGFVTSLVNTDNQDYLIGCNRHDNYLRWNGAVTVLDGALSGGETAVTVDTVLMSEVFDSRSSGDVSASSATTLQLSSSVWAADQWNSFYVYIKTGAEAGQIRKISDTTGDTITFATLAGDPGSCDFEIRKPMFSDSGNIIYGGTEITYTSMPTYNTFAVSSAHAGSDGAGVAQAVDEYPANPRGNRLTNYLSRIIVGNVRSAQARDSGGALQGYASAGSYFVSKLNNPTDFGFSATRVAGEGDIVGTPYGGGDITDAQVFEDYAAIFKKRYIELVQYSQDANDLAVRTPIKSEIGSAGRVIKGPDDIYFITDDKQFTSLGRVRSKDTTPATQNIGLKIKRLLETYVHGEGRGIVDGNKIYIPAKSSSTETKNDIIVVYNIDNDAFEGIWDISADALERWNGNLYYGESTGANVYKMNTGRSDVIGTTRYPISSSYATHFMNFASNKGNQQAMNSLYFEGYISGSTKITFEVWKDFASDPLIEFDFQGTETGLLDGTELSANLGSASLCLQPIGSIGEADEEGRRHFFFRVYFPWQYGNHFSVGASSLGADFNYEITRIGLGLKETVSVNTNRIKNI